MASRSPSTRAASMPWSDRTAPGSAAVAGQLGDGEPRQLGLAMRLATGPSLLLLNEPLAGLGDDEALRVMELLREVARGRTVVLVEHDMDAVFSVADAVTVLV